MAAKGVMFTTIEDETGLANLLIWPKVFEEFRRVILPGGMMAVRGRIQREGEVVHLVARRISDLSADLASVGDDDIFPLPLWSWRSGSSRRLGARSSRTAATWTTARNFYDPYGHIDEVEVKTRNFLYITSSNCGRYRSRSA